MSNTDNNVQNVGAGLAPICVHIRPVRASGQDRGKPRPYYTRAWQADSSSIVGAYPCGRPRGWDGFTLTPMGQAQSLHQSHLAPNNWWNLE